MTNTNILDLENRRRIYNCILKNPGLHQRNLSKKLRVPFSTLYYHLRYLKKLDLIIEKKIGRYSRYYTKNTIGRGDKEFLNIIRQYIPRNIIVFICIYYVASQKELSIDLDKHHTTIKVHLKKLLDMDIIEIAPVKNGTINNNRPNGPL
jgi:predicted transcriptional regulator